jgi:hypothetical protein
VNQPSCHLQGDTCHMEPGSRPDPCNPGVPQLYPRHRDAGRDMEIDHFHGWFYCRKPKNHRNTEYTGFFFIFSCVLCVSVVKF